jgi:hypothetical protein
MTLAIDGREITLTDVDLNVWFDDALWIINAGNDERLTAAKESLAKSIEARLVSVEATPLRELPPPPAITGQIAEPAKRPHDDPSVLALWDYSFTYHASRDPHDEVIARVERGVVQPRLKSGAPDDERLFRALARFQILHQDAAPDLVCELANDVAAAYAAHEPAQPTPDLTGGGETPEETFNVFTTRSASAVVQVIRNRAADAFRFVAETTASAEAPRLLHDSFDLATLTGTSLEELLASFFRALITGNATVKLTAAYREESAQIPIVAAAGDPHDPAWRAGIGEAIRKWFETQRPEIGPASILTFELTVVVDGMPLIELRDLYIDANRVVERARAARRAPQRKTII